MKRKTRAENYHGRPNWRTRAVVDAAIELRDRDSVKAAAEFLCSQGISLILTLRVLAQATAE
jgi:hypothetical protein